MHSRSGLRPGDTLGRYEILMPVAQGGMASVWAARLVGTRGFQKVVAIKTILPELTDDPDFEAMFLDEARLAARIRHPHVAEIIDLGEEDDWLYLVMEWISGETIFTLNKVARQKGGVPMPLLLRILSNTCAGLHAAHELRDETGRPLDLVHRDISPQNIMVSFDGIVKIVDFGVAKAAGRMHETRVVGIMKGKVPYLSPEQLSGLKVDRRSDIFSLGILMYVMVTGRHPFRGANDPATMENICKRAPVPLRELVPDLRPDIEAIVLRALEKEPAARFADCAEMQRAIDTAANALGTSVTDGDVAAFLRTTLGDIVDKHRAQLADAIREADARAMRPVESSSSRPRPRFETPSQLKGGTPLPPTYHGILPVALDDEAPRSAPSSARSKTATTAPPPRARVPTFHPSGRKKRAPLLTIALVALFALVGLSAFAVHQGMLPWVAQRLPWLAPGGEAASPNAPTAAARDATAPAPSSRAPTAPARAAAPKPASPTPVAPPKAPPAPSP